MIPVRGFVRERLNLQLTKDNTMNISRFETAVRNHSLLGIKFVLSGLALFASNAMAGEVNNLKVETVNARSGCIASATVKGMDNKIYVSGRVRLNQPFQPSAGTHVDVYLLDKNGQTLERKKDRIIVTSQKRDRTQGGQFSYAVSFDNSMAAKAVTARVVYCSSTHDDQS